MVETSKINEVIVDAVTDTNASVGAILQTSLTLMLVSAETLNEEGKHRLAIALRKLADEVENEKKETENE